MHPSQRRTPLLQAYGLTVCPAPITTTNISSHQFAHATTYPVLPNLIQVSSQPQLSNFFKWHLDIDFFPFFLFLSLSYHVFDSIILLVELVQSSQLSKKAFPIFFVLIINSDNRKHEVFMLLSSPLSYKQLFNVVLWVWSVGIKGYQ